MLLLFSTSFAFIVSATLSAKFATALKSDGQLRRELAISEISQKKTDVFNRIS